MGRSIPSISNRLDAKISQWQRLAHTLRGKDRVAFEELVKLVRDHRTEIDAADEPDITGAINLIVLLHLLGEVNEKFRPQNGLSSTGPLD